MQGEDKNGDPKDPMSEVFGEPISVYTTEDALEDGILFGAGRLLNRDIVLTTNLIATLEKEAIIAAVITGLAKTMEFTRPDLAVYHIGKQKLYVDDNGITITIMLPEDY